MRLSFFLKITYLTVFSLQDKPIIPDRTISTILQVLRIEDRHNSSLSLVPIIKKALQWCAFRFILKITYLTVFSLRDKPIIPDRTVSTILQVSQIEERHNSSLSLVPVIKKALQWCAFRFILKITYLTVFSLRDKPIIPDRTISTILQVSRIEEWSSPKY